MRPLVKLFMVFCLIGIVLSRPMPEGEEEDAKESPDVANGESKNTDDGGEEASQGGDEAASKDGDEEASQGGDEAASKDGGEETSQGGDDADSKASGDENAKESNDEADGAKEDGDKQESTGGNDGGDNAGQGAGKEEKNPVNTYNKVVALLNKDVKVDNIQSEYLRSALNNDLQTEVRNPVVEAISRIGSYTKIQECFKSMGSDVKKVIDEEEKAFKDCMTEKKSEYQCSEDSFASAKGKLSPITSKIKSCVSSKGR